MSYRKHLSDDVDPQKCQMEFFNFISDKEISAADKRFDSLQVPNNNFGFLYDLKKLNEMGRIELIGSDGKMSEPVENTIT